MLGMLGAEMLEALCEETLSMPASMSSAVTTTPAAQTASRRCASHCESCAMTPPTLVSALVRRAPSLHWRCYLVSPAHGSSEGRRSGVGVQRPQLAPHEGRRLARNIGQLDVGRERRACEQPRQLAQPHFHALIGGGGEQRASTVRGAGMVPGVGRLISWRKMARMGAGMSSICSAVPRRATLPPLPSQYSLARAANSFATLPAGVWSTS